MSRTCESLNNGKSFDYNTFYKCFGVRLNDFNDLFESASRHQLILIFSCKQGISYHSINLRVHLLSKYCNKLIDFVLASDEDDLLVNTFINCLIIPFLIISF
jgi:hypothetical protein